MILTLYVFMMLRYMDTLLAAQITNYQPIRSYSLGALFFFIAVTFIAVIARKLNWRNITNYSIAALGIFFPLVVLASIIRVMYGLPEATTAFYVREYCDITTTQHLCGPAFAHIVYSMTVRALPIVLTVPILYRLLIFSLTSLLNKHWPSTQK